jgi:hypothetical protein
MATFLTSVLDDGYSSASWLDCLGGWVHPRDGLDVLEYRKISYSCQESKPRPSSD